MKASATQAIIVCLTIGFVVGYYVATAQYR